MGEEFRRGCGAGPDRRYPGISGEHVADGGEDDDPCLTAVDARSRGRRTDRGQLPPSRPEIFC